MGQVLELTEAENWEQTTGITVAETVAVWSDIYDDLVLMATCNPPGGGDVDYELQDDITLVSDATTYTLSDLDLLSGRDLRIEILLAGTDASKRYLRLRINALTTSIYWYQQVWFGTASNYRRLTTTYFEMRGVALGSTTPQNMYGYVVLDIPRWKDDDRYPVIAFEGYSDDVTHKGKCHVQSVVDVQSIDLFLNVGDIKAGTKIAVYTRGT